MKRGYWMAGAAFILSSTIVLAQRAPENILPPGMDVPAPTPSASPRPSPKPSARPSAAPVTKTAPSQSGEVVQALPSATPDVVDTSGVDLSDIPSAEELEAMSTAELDTILGLKPRFDIPPAARRATERVGIIDPSEGGLPIGSLVNQPASLVRATLAGIEGPMVSRWGHILMRRALASRLDTPKGMDAVEFATLRAHVLNILGEYAAARALVQDIDTANYSPALTEVAINAYIGTADIVGACPAVNLGTGNDDTLRWAMLQGICAAFAGESQSAKNDLRRLLSRSDKNVQIDILLAQRFAGTASEGRRAVTIEWDDVEELNPWRFALANALGEPIPENLTDTLAHNYLIAEAITPALSVAQRIRGANAAAASGVFSAAAIIDLYSQLYAYQDAAESRALITASHLRDAYIDPSSANRIASIHKIWDGNDADYGHHVLTAYAAARVTPSEDFSEDAGELIASMLTAGLDRDAMRWANVVEGGSLGWALLALADPQGGMVNQSDFSSFWDNDVSSGQRKAKMLLAGLAGLNRLQDGAIANYSQDLGTNIGAPTRWTQMIDQAATVNNRALVAYLAGLGMQGDSWDQMTARHLFHIVSALNAVGMDAEARMIAAEAVARA